MLRPILRNLSVYGASLPTLATTPPVSRATIYMPSHLAARMLGDLTPGAVVAALDAPLEHLDASDSHAA